jgi:type VI secretion system protein ImpJ
MWSEGMFLTPHHFQQWDRFYEHLLQIRLRGVQNLDWGVIEVKLSEEQLANGQLALAKLVAVLPDGLAVDIPDLDPLPETRPVEPYFDPKRDRLGVYLGAPVVRPGIPACATDGTPAGRPTRYKRKMVQVADDNTGSNEREISAARKELKLLFDGEPLDDYVTLKVAELERSATGTFSLRPSFVPPCLYVSASPFLMTILRRIVEILSTKSADLAKGRRQRAQGLIEFTMSEAAQFWLLHTVNTYIPTLLHLYDHSSCHPREVYLELARLTGELYTFATEGHPKDVPKYVHLELSSTFGQLEEKLRLLLETSITVRCIPIPLQRVRESVYTARVPDEQLLETGHFYLSVMADVPEEKVAKEIPIHAKISSVDRVDKLIAAAMRGVGLKHLPAPPAEIPVQPGRQYFEFDKRGEHWDAIKSSRAMSVYVPPSFTGLKLELMAVKE